MISEPYSPRTRNTKTVRLQADLVVVGGGLSGVCASITAARSGLKVVLVQDRPVLGGNASSEVRLWSLGATSHMGNNNRWSREGGLINEILLDNLKRNKEGNPLLFDTVLLEKVYEEENITLLLNTAVYGVEKGNDDHVKNVTAFCSQNSTTYIASAPLFCDASGDGIVAFMAGASFRMGAETREEFDEGFAPNIDDYGNLLGHSLYFYTKDAGKPIPYTPPSFALKNAEELPRIKNFQLGDHGCKLWWVEYGGRLDTVHQSEEIKFELWKVVYGIWDYVKNSGKFPEAENLTLEWVGTIPGKRESRRFEGDFMLTQKDIVEQRDYYDAVAFGGWAMDLHPADGIYSEHNSCTQWHGKGVYTIPYRCYYSKNIKNLFLAGRIISASHVAFGSSRVMLTCAHGAQAVGEAAVLCRQEDLLPRDVASEEHIGKLQLALNRNGQSIPRIALKDPDDLVKQAHVEASSTLRFSGFSEGGDWKPLKFGLAQMLPLRAHGNYRFVLEVDALEATNLELQLKGCSAPIHFTPDVILDKTVIELRKGRQKIAFETTKPQEQDGYSFFCLMKNEQVRVRLSDDRITGLLTVENKINKAVSNYGRQDPPAGINIDSFEFWTPERRPKGKNIALQITKALPIFEAANIKNGEVRPTPNGNTNAWVAKIEDKKPTLYLKWDGKVNIKTIKLFFDCDYDHALETTLMGHPEEVIPFVVADYRIKDSSGNVLKEINGNYQAINTIDLGHVVSTDGLVFEFSKREDNIPVSVFKISVFE
ncbi:FAD-dependent oxidoreductase [Pseudozobellia thermophila]|uniref:FAD dependent oxidoreductase n=1 Tax=Pseudozobellia thermophila TaxID=192903 RepID=A0A1M6G438_9FLAO|nr:FAD-dependent oxidoreductase [Pseudozobellia thermophila]SHJ04751.1 FAD dependent oxidoreductase [Pseudozobellia thermophila]